MVQRDQAARQFNVAREFLGQLPALGVGRGFAGKYRRATT